MKHFVYISDNIKHIKHEFCDGVAVSGLFWITSPIVWSILFGINTLIVWSVSFRIISQKNSIHFGMIYLTLLSILFEIRFLIQLSFFWGGIWSLLYSTKYFIKMNPLLVLGILLRMNCLISIFENEFIHRIKHFYQ